MKACAILMTFIISVALTPPAGVSAKEYNKWPDRDAGAQAKVSSAIAGAHRHQTLKAVQPGRVISTVCEESKTDNSSDSQNQLHGMIIVGKDIINMGGDC